MAIEFLPIRLSFCPTQWPGDEWLCLPLTAPEPQRRRFNSLKKSLPFIHLHTPSSEVSLENICHIVPGATTQRPVLAGDLVYGVRPKFPFCLSQKSRPFTKVYMRSDLALINLTPTAKYHKWYAIQLCPVLEKWKKKDLNLPASYICRRQEDSSWATRSDRVCLAS